MMMKMEVKMMFMKMEVKMKMFKIKNEARYGHGSII